MDHEQSLAFVDAAPLGMVGKMRAWLTSIGQSATFMQVVQFLMSNPILVQDAIAGNWTKLKDDFLAAWIAAHPVKA